MHDGFSGADKKTRVQVPCTLLQSVESVFALFQVRGIRDPETLGWGHPTALENSQAGTFNIGYDLELTARSKAPNQYIHDLVSRALYYRWVTGSPLEGVEPEPIIIPSKTGSIIPYSNQLSRVFSGWWFHLFYFIFHSMNG